MAARKNLSYNDVDMKAYLFDRPLLFITILGEFRSIVCADYVD